MRFLGLWLATFGSLVAWACSGDETTEVATATVAATAGTGGAGGATVVSSSAAQGGSGATGGSAPVDLRVLTINLKTPVTGGDDVETRTQIVIDAIDLLQPDFVALQEVTVTSSSTNRAEAIADATGYEWGWYVTHDFVVYQEGPGYLSRWPVSWTETVDLPHDDLGGTVTRVTLGVGLQTPHGELSFFSSHATVDPDEQVKADQALASWQFVHSKDNGLPAFFAGDLNAEPDSLAMQFLRGEATHDGMTGDFTDAWLEVNASDPGYTIPSDAPERRIDYIYMAPSSASVVACELVFDEAVEGVYASDHIGVLCDFAL